jgi:uncharacterized protein (DUF1697 family)
MPTFIALLRGINVGKAKRVPMAELRALMDQLGYTGVATLLNSGNVAFRAAKGAAAGHAAKIAEAIALEMKVQVPVIVKSAQELDAIISENPLAATAPDHARLLIAFVQDNGELPRLDPIDPLLTPSEQFVIGKHAAYLHCPGGILQSKAGEAMLGKTGKSATTRNWATVLRLQSLAAEAGA